MRLIVDRQRCLGAAQCVLSAPDLFDQSALDGQVVVRREPAADELLDVVRVVVRLCPSGALRLTDEA
ncbi:ferredoxin [Micromonospora sp. WMMD1082]|uniref:ferredoxin n=1 Tax=Micromonospora sp. WMMD1082 TaxID=3016104 RepID=UPI0024160ECE|nr:ferredoxin [Micromonospora sp. WMMD1082]MDG4792769.1 ferredoxin [Micromonospora sp. WMMD1082]